MLPFKYIIVKLGVVVVVVVGERMGYGPEIKQASYQPSLKMHTDAFCLYVHFCSNGQLTLMAQDDFNQYRKKY